MINEVFGTRLIKEMEKKPSILLVKDQGFLDLQQSLEIPILFLDKQTSDEYFFQALDKQPLDKSIKKWLLKCEKKFAIFEPFDRISKSITNNMNFGGNSFSTVSTNQRGQIES